MRVISQKVETVHGRQPDVVVRHESVRPMLHAMYEGKWVPVSWDASIRLVDTNKLKYSDTVDNLKEIKLGTHVHWAASHLIQG
jgi:anaerobic selenocysteine-containing dehydrogenase